MQRYFNVVAILLAALGGAVLLPAVAAAGCPGCEEYTLDIPENDSGSDPAPAPAPAVPAAPAAPATPTTTVPEATTPTAPAVVAPVEPDKPAKPVDTDPDPVPSSAAVKPVDLAGVPALAASQARPLPSGEDGSGGVLPLAIAMGAVALVAAAFGARRRGAGTDPEATRSG